MKRLITHPTSTAQWYQLVNEAEQAANCQLHEDVESYLVFLLMRFAKRPDMASRILAVEYLRALHKAGESRKVALRSVGDQCLLFTGLFPKRAQRRPLKLSYFVDLGRSSYHTLSESIEKGLAEVYASLCDEFVSLMNVLQAMRATVPATTLVSDGRDVGSTARVGSESIPVGMKPRIRH